MRTATPASLADRFRASAAPFFVLVPLALVGLLLAAVIPFGPGTLDLVMLAAWFLAMCFTVWSAGSSDLLDVVRSPGVPRPPEGPVPTIDRLALFGMLLFGLGGITALIACLVVDLSHDPADGGAVVNVSLGSFISALGFAVSGILLRRLADREAFALLHVALDAEPLGPASSAGALVRLRGVVNDPTPVATPAGPAAFAITEAIEHTPGTDPNIVSGSLANDRTFLVTADHVAVELDGQGAHWAPGERLTWSARTASGNEQTVNLDYLPLGALVTVAGVLRSWARPGVATLTASPDAPVVLLRHEPDDDPLAPLRASRRRRRLAPVLLVALVVAIVATGAAMLRALPPGTPSASAAPAAPMARSAAAALVY